jgi:AcrR family transcriptional regulator
MYIFWVSPRRTVTRFRGSDDAPRKKPQQARSRATIDAIIEAGAQVLGSGGYAALNTNQVARVAGVSIGTFYQYFPNKLALLDAIRRRHFDEVLCAVADATRPTKATENSVDELVDGMIAAHAALPAFHRALLDEAPARAQDEHPVEFERAYFAAYAELLRLAAGPEGSVEGDFAARVLACAVEGAVHDGARRGVLESPSFSRELKRLILGRLCPPATEG